MNESLPQLFLVRHGDTEWSLSHRHTSVTDLPLLPQGEINAAKLAPRLAATKFSAVFTSPLQRARKTAELAGFASVAQVDPDIIEWSYGDYEGLTTTQIRQNNPNWDLFRDGCPHGESPQQAAARADRFIAKVRKIPGNTLAFGSAHILRVVASRWLGWPPDGGRCFLASTSSISILGYEHNPGEPVIKMWNAT